MNETPLKVFILACKLTLIYLPLFYLADFMHAKYQVESINYLAFNLPFKAALEAHAGNNFLIQIYWHILNFVLLLIGSFILIEERKLGLIVLVLYFLAALPIFNTSTIFL